MWRHDGVQWSAPVSSSRRLLEVWAMHVPTGCQPDRHSRLHDRRSPRPDPEVHGSGVMMLTILNCVGRQTMPTKSQRVFAFAATAGPATAGSDSPSSLAAAATTGAWVRAERNAHLPRTELEVS